MKRNTKYYLLLTIPHIALLIYNLIKNKEKKPIVLYFTSVGFAYLFEIVILNYFKSYRYYPKVFKNNWVDTIFGAITSQAFLVPMTATTMASFRLGWKWRWGATFLYTIIERLFIREHLFKNNWWRTAYTTGSLPFFFWLMEKWSKMREGRFQKWVGHTNIFFFVWVNYTNLYFLLVTVFKKFLFGRNKIWKKYVMHFYLYPPFSIIQSFVIYISIVKGKFVMGVVGAHILDQLLYRLKWIQTRSWSVYCFLPIHIGMYWLGKLFKKYMISGTNGS
ncbi:hypothetical protein [Heyndrickxia vini]|uniref:Uncharacterized protein n=1 Tax=Heyndrickxia vini TaxID=1476025 RepID=A0ABX7E2M6_9BACI|nr:hypothetical protein [Heyndrickxia vini]QQZ09976.1 hypothetical protein I5776_03110 [Heyndrickxia vini]